MKPFIPNEKQSKKMRRAQAQARRGGWGEISPVTRVVPNKKQYNRKNARWKKELPFSDGRFVSL